MKKTVFMLLAWVAFAGTMSAEGSRYHRIFVDGIRYILDSQTQTASVTFEDDATKWTDANYAGISGTLTVRASVEENSITYPVISVGVAAFAHCQNLETVILPNTIVELEESAFSHSSITSIFLPNSVNNIKASAFTSCPNLVSVNIPEGVDSIATGTFSWSPSLRNVTLPNSLTKIGYQAFYGCTALNALAIPDGVTEIGDMAFLYGNLSSLILPAGLTTIGEYAFSGNAHMQGVYVDAANEHFYSEDGVLFNKAMTELIYYPTGRDGAYAIPDGVQTIKKGAFLTAAFSSISIPASVTMIEDGVFYGCANIRAIDCDNTTPPACGGNVFDEVDKENCILYVPFGSLNAYETTSPWSEFVHISGKEDPGQETGITVLYEDREGGSLGSENVTLHLPQAPVIEGFVFLYWQVAEGQLEDGIILQAVYQANAGESAPAMYVNPSNRVQKLIRKGNVYILSDDKVYSITGAKICNAQGTF